MPKVLIVDDEEPLRASLTYALTREGYSVSTAADGNAALLRAQADDPDVVVLDVMLPGLDGMEVCRRLRQTSDVPIVMLTAKDQRKEKVGGLNLGADDYVTKPFDTPELIARIGAVLRRRASAEALLEQDRALVEKMEALIRQAGVPRLEAELDIGRPSGGALQVGGLKMDLDHRSATLYGGQLRLTPAEYALLRVLMTYAGRVVTRTELIESVWGKDAQDGHTLLAVHMRTLREKVEDDPANPKLLIGVPGIGFRIEASPLS